MTTPSNRGGGTRARRAAQQPAVPSKGGSGQPKPPPAGSTPNAAPAARADGAGASPKRGRRGALDPDAVVALEEERDFLLKSLDDLEREHDAGDVDDGDYEGLRDDYTARAAAAIRALDEHAVVIAARRSDRSWVRIAAVLVIVAIIGGGAGWLVASSSGERNPNGGLSGDIRASSLGEIQKAKSFAGQAQQAASEGNSAEAVELFQEAIGAYQAALAIDPNNVEALAYKGWLFHLIALQSGDADLAAQVDATALESLDQALTIKPTYADALVFRAVIAEGQGRPADALVDLNNLPEGSLPTAMSGLVDNVRQEAQAAVNAATTSTTPG